MHEQIKHILYYIFSNYSHIQLYLFLILFLLLLLFEMKFFFFFHIKFSFVIKNFIYLLFFSLIRIIFSTHILVHNMNTHIFLFLIPC